MREAPGFSDGTEVMMSQAYLYRGGLLEVRDLLQQVLTPELSDSQYRLVDSL